MPRPKGTGGQAAKLTEAEIRRVDRCLTGTRHEQRNRALFFLGLGSGMRISEMVGLWVEDVMPHGELLAEIVIEKHSTKGKHSRNVILTDQAVDALQEYLEWRVEEVEGDLRLDAPLFPSQRNPRKPLTANAGSHLLKQIFKDAGVANASAHSLRSTHADMMRQHGADLEMVRMQLGHTDIRTTARYYRITEEEKRALIRKIRFRT